MQYIGYIVLRGVGFLFSLIPFSVLYRISNGLSWIFYKVIKYRYKVIYANLKKAFPEKNDAEIEQIIKATYLNISDLIVESLKGWSLTSDQLAERWFIKNPEILSPYFEKGRSVVITAAHFNNWEWGTVVINKSIQHQVLAIYKPIKNKFIEKYFKDLRAQEGMILAPLRDSRPIIEENLNKNIGLVLIGDQSPSNPNNAHWVDFFGIDTPCLHGIDTFSRAYDMPVFFFNVQRVKRGWYEIVIEPIELNPSTQPEAAITLKFMQKVEQVIRQNPANWLWSHKRWKHQRGNGK